MLEKRIARNTGLHVLTPIASHTHTHTQLLLTIVKLFCTATVHALKAVPQIRSIAHTSFSGRLVTSLTNVAARTEQVTVIYTSVEHGQKGAERVS
jgi:hypothetical protein